MGIFGGERVGDRRVAPASGRGRGAELLEPLPYRRRRRRFRRRRRRRRRRARSTRCIGERATTRRGVSAALTCGCRGVCAPPNDGLSATASVRVRGVGRGGGGGPCSGSSAAAVDGPRRTAGRRVSPVTTDWSAECCARARGRAGDGALLRHLLVATMGPMGGGHRAAAVPAACVCGSRRRVRRDGCSGLDRLFRIWWGSVALLLNLRIFHGTCLTGLSGVTRCETVRRTQHLLQCFRMENGPGFFRFVLFPPDLHS